ncbi:hypothetical protein ABZ341_17965 [Streptomyces sp. NPDC006173]|uniref:hypothetical protein n=1 Tax=Streptomyces sp. NPDC006173 TaxID=3155349 RepID=UPI0034047B1E
MSDYPEIAARFTRGTAGHEMAVLFDQGLYRHLRFASPDGSGYRFDLHTSPNRLMFSGEVGIYVFSVWPTVDLFKVFSESSVGDQPNFGYWTEKLAAWSEPAIQFSNDRFDAQIAHELAEGENDWPGVTDAWTAKSSGFLAEYSFETEQAARFAACDFSFQADDTESWEPAFKFSDCARWVLDDYDWRYLWACHAALYGIGQYNAATVTEVGQAAQHFDKVPDPLDGCHWCACGNRWPCKDAGAVAA